ncbi:crossover junction endodeoxyribonuclease RuvC [Candidatus Marinamargulisbacteria bacterium SCGC AG-343-D04]|nr:crossover junction endodeoxyribonuclease RuvC [Candidatus Marinamargulisbacteria bacterium SCGC AG-343-D04]
MIILGLDPGLATTGFGIIEKKRSKLIPLDYGVLITAPTLTLPERLSIISKELRKLFKKYTIEEVAVEELFFNTNTKTAMAVAQARGVMLLAAQDQKKSVFSYTPPQVKSGVCGFGKAVKEQVQYMVKQLLHLDSTPKPDDAADALAVAICHAHSAKLLKI